MTSLGLLRRRRRQRDRMASTARTGLVAAAGLTLAVAGCLGPELEEGYFAKYDEIGTFCQAHDTASGVQPVEISETPSQSDTYVYSIALAFDRDDLGNPSGDHEGLLGALQKLVDIQEETGRYVPATIYVGSSPLLEEEVKILREHRDQFQVVMKIQDTWGGGQKFPYARGDNQIKNNVNFHAMHRIVGEQKQALVEDGVMTDPATWMMISSSGGFTYDHDNDRSTPEIPDGAQVRRLQVQLHSAMGVGMTWNKVMPKKVVASGCIPSEPGGSSCSWTYNSSNRIYPGLAKTTWYCDSIYDHAEAGASKDDLDAACEDAYVTAFKNKLKYYGPSSMGPDDFTWTSATVLVESGKNMFNYTNVPLDQIDGRSVPINALPKLVEELTKGCLADPFPGADPCYLFVKPTDTEVFDAYARTMSARVAPVVDDLAHTQTDVDTQTVSTYSVTNWPAKPLLAEGVEWSDVPNKERPKNSGHVFLRLELSGVEDLWHQLNASYEALEQAKEDHKNAGCKDNWTIDPCEGYEMQMFEHEAFLASNSLRVDLTLPKDGNIVHAPGAWSIPDLAECARGRCNQVMIRKLDGQDRAQITSFNVRLADDPEANVASDPKILVVEGYVGYHKLTNEDWRLAVTHPKGMPSPVTRFELDYVRDPVQWAMDELDRYKKPYTGNHTNTLSRRVLCDGLDKTMGAEECIWGGKIPVTLGMCVGDAGRFSDGQLNAGLGITNPTE